LVGKNTNSCYIFLIIFEKKNFLFWAATPKAHIGLSALVPVAQAVFRHGCARASSGRCVQPASHPLVPPGAAAPIPRAERKTMNKRMP